MTMARDDAESNQASAKTTSGTSRLENLQTPVIQKRTIIRYTSGTVEEREDIIASEYVLTIFVNDQELATIVCTPEHLDDLVMGFLASEGIVRSLSQITDLHIHQQRGIARVRTLHKMNFNQAFFNKRYVASCCGKGRQLFYFYNDAHTAKRVGDSSELRPSDVLAMVDRMEADATLFRETGGVHTASLYDAFGDFSVFRADIGRHNALDKLYGHVLKSGRQLHGHAIAFSGRLSSEVLLKVAKIGCAFVFAKSAPTSLAVETAHELNITAIGFVRGQSFNVYTHPWRIRF